MKRILLNFILFYLTVNRGNTYNKLRRYLQE